MEQRQQIFDMIMQKTFDAYNAEKELKSKVYFLTTNEEEEDALCINEMYKNNTKLGNISDAMVSFLNTLALKEKMDEAIEHFKKRGDSLIGIMHVDVYESETTKVKVNFSAHQFHETKSFMVTTNDNPEIYMNENGALIDRVFNFEKIENE